MAHVAGKANTTSALTMLLDETLCSVNYSVILILSPSNDADIAESSQLVESDNVDIMFSVAVTKNLFTESAVI